MMDQPMFGPAGLAGIVLIAVIVWEVFSDLFHPGGPGAEQLGRTPHFNICRRKPEFLALAGPVALGLAPSRATSRTRGSPGRRRSARRH